MAKVVQLTVPVINRPGSLARVAQILGAANVDIRAFLTGVENGEGYVEVVVDNANRAKKALKDAGLPFTEQVVLHVEIPNKTGSLGTLTAKLAAKNINITWGYGSTTKGARKASVVLNVSDLDKAARVR